MVELPFLPADAAVVSPVALDAWDRLRSLPTVYRDPYGWWIVDETPEDPGSFAVFTGRHAEDRARRYREWLAGQKPYNPYT